MEALHHVMHPFLGWLLETTVIGGILVCLILLVQRLFGGRLGPRWSHALWLVLLVRMVLPWTPSVSVDLAGLIPASGPQEPMSHPAEDPHSHGVYRPAEGVKSGQATEYPPAGPAEVATRPVPRGMQKPTARESREMELLSAIRRILPWLWLAGAILLGGWLFASNFALWRIVKREHPLIQQPILELFEQCKAQMGVQTIVALVPSDRVSTAALFGFLRPRLLLPRELIETASPEELRYIFLHELGHLKRHDIYIGWLASLVQVLHWFNPFIWLGFYRMRNDRELACDALVLTRTCAEESHTYGRTMVGLLGRFSRAKPLPAMAGILESKAQLKRRITMIARFTTDRYRWSPTAVSLIVALACVPLINAQPAGTSPLSGDSGGANVHRFDYAQSEDLITDPNTGLEFHKVCGITGSNDDIGPNLTGVVLDGVMVIDGDLKELEVPGFDALRIQCSPDRTRIAFYANGAIWVMPISPKTGESVGPARKLVDGNFWYQTKVRWSPDSQKFVYVAEDEHLYVCSVEDGTTKRITREPALVRAQGGWSPDGRWIACRARYNTEEGGLKDYICLIPSQGGKSRRLVEVHPSAHPHPSWTPDGKWLAYQWRGGLHFVRVSDGFTADVTLPEEVGGFVSWSSDDGKMLLYRDSREWRDMLRIVSASGGEPIRPDVWSAGPPIWTPDSAFVLTDGPYQDTWTYWVLPFAGAERRPYPLPLESQDGYAPSGPEILAPSTKQLFFAKPSSSNRMTYWVAPISIADGRFAGPATEVFGQGEIQRGPGVHWSPDESRLALVSDGDLWMARIDGGPAIRFSRPADRSVVRHAWSPDGSAISWITHDPQSGQSILRVRRLPDDEPRDLVSTSKFIDHQWSASGKWIACKLYENELGTERELFGVLAAGGEVTPLMKQDYDDKHEAFSYAWCPQDDQIALLSGRKLLVLNPATGQHRQIGETLDPRWGRCFDVEWSPDGSTLGLILETRPRSGHSSYGLLTVDMHDGTCNELTPKDDSHNHYWLSWSPDSRWIAYDSEEWVRVRPEGVLWAVDIDPFLKRATGEDAASATRVHGAGPTLRKIEIRGPGRVHSRPSFDGRYMSDVDPETENLVIRDLTTGEQRHLTKKDSAIEGFAYWSAIAPDSTKVVYRWFDYAKEDFDLRVVGLDGSNDRLLWGATEGAAYFNVDTWSPDSRYVYGELLEKDAPARLVRVSIADGARQVVKEFGGRRFFTVSCSPDGRYLAYDCAEKEAASRDIFIYGLETKHEWPLVRDAANDKLLGWTPAGDQIFFTSNRNGTWDGWLLRVDKGQRQGTPQMIEAGMGDVSPIGFTQDGSFYYKYRHRGWDVYTAVLGPDGQSVREGPEPVRQVGKDICPAWSPDGQFLAYLSEPDKDKPQTIRLRTLATGREREIKPDLPYFQWLRWCPDSRHLLLTDVPGQSVVYRFDVHTGRHSTLVQEEQEDSGDRIRQVELSADGKTLAYRIRGRGNLNLLRVRDLDTGREKELLRTEAMGSISLCPLSGWALSPDGSQVALCLREGDAENPFALKVMSVASGESTTVVEDGASQVAWAGNGRDLLFTKDQKELWTVPARRGEPRRLLQWRGWIVAPRLHSDGRQVAFFSGGTVSEMWVMESFLPPSVAAGSY